MDKNLQVYLVNEWSKKTYSNLVGSSKKSKIPPFLSWNWSHTLHFLLYYFFVKSFNIFFKIVRIWTIYRREVRPQARWPWSDTKPPHSQTQDSTLKTHGTAINRIRNWKNMAKRWYYISCRANILTIFFVSVTEPNNSSISEVLGKWEYSFIGINPRST